MKFSSLPKIILFDVPYFYKNSNINLTREQYNKYFKAIDVFKFKTVAF